MLEITLHNGRGFGGEERLTSHRDLLTWKGIERHFSSFEMSDERRGAYRFEVDWNPLLKSLDLEMRRYATSLEERAALFPGYLFDFEHKCGVLVRPRQATEHPGAAADLLHRALLDAFLIGNLSCPGSINFHRASISDLQKRRSPMERVEVEVDASQYYLETAWEESLTGPWLKVGHIPFEIVLSWYRDLNLSRKNAAASGIERALFTLLHIGRSKGYIDPGDIIWLASAIESLYGLGPGSTSHSILHRRIVALLSTTAKESAELKINLRNFFELRNKFAHGGGIILHPVVDDRDEVGEQSINDFLKNTNFAAALLVGSIQELIRRGWSGMSFEEKLSPSTR